MVYLVVLQASALALLHKVDYCSIAYRLYIKAPLVRSIES